MKPTPEALDDLRDDLSRFYGVWDVNQFASMILDRTVRAEDLSHKEIQEVRVAAKLAHRPYEQAWVDEQNALHDALTHEQASEVGAMWLL